MHRGSRCLSIAVLMVACAHAKPAEETKTEVTPAPAPPVLTAKAPRPQLVGTADAATGPEVKEGQRDLEKAVVGLQSVNVFFGYDDATLTAEAREKLAVVADVMRKHRALSIRIEGNCDERGTEGYNLVLGQQRADSAKKYLVDLDVGADQVQTVSYGAERPKNPEHHEDAWKQNRRDDVVISPPPK